MTTDEQSHPEPEEAGLAPDLEDKLAQLHALKTAENNAKEAYEKLRDQILPELDTSRYFIDDEGVKRYAYKVEPEKLIIDPGLLDMIDPEVLDKVAPRQVDRKKLQQEVAAARIDLEVYTRHTRFEPGTPHIRFGDND